MSVVHCTPDYYATLLVLFKKYRCELGLSEFATKHLFAGKVNEGYGDSERISEAIIKKMIVVNSYNYCQKYPIHPDEIINNEKDATEYLQYGRVNQEYLKLSETMPQLLSQAINFWLYNTEETQGKTGVYKMLLDCARKYSFWAMTQKIPYVWEIPSPGVEIKIMPCRYKG